MKEETPELEKYSCPFCKISFGGSKRFKRHVLKCAPTEELDLKPFQANVPEANVPEGRDSLPKKHGSRIYSYEYNCL